MQPKDVLPPKGPFFSGQMRDNILIVLLPYETNPLHISFPIKLIKLFQKKGIILNTKVNHTKPPFALRPSNKVPCCKIVFLLVELFPSPKAVFPVPIQDINTITGSLREHM
jgi:hypothetical protein